MATVLDQSGYTLYLPDDGGGVVAIFAHADQDDHDISSQSVKLGYYVPHNEDLDASIDMAKAEPAFPAGVDEHGDARDVWHSYKLTRIHEIKPEELEAWVDSNKVAVAYVTETVYTADIVGQLSGMGFGEIRGVHCRGK